MLMKIKHFLRAWILYTVNVRCDVTLWLLTPDGVRGSDSLGVIWRDEWRVSSDQICRYEPDLVSLTLVLVCNTLTEQLVMLPWKSTYRTFSASETSETMSENRKASLKVGFNFSSFVIRNNDINDIMIIVVLFKNVQCTRCKKASRGRVLSFIPFFECSSLLNILNLCTFQ